MSTRAIYSYIYTLIISVIAVVSSTIAYAQEDSTSSDTVTVKKEKKIESINSQLCIGIEQVWL
jgi:lipopolysaccharide export system protein LptC